MLERCERKILLGWMLLELPNRVNLFRAAKYGVRTETDTPRRQSTQVDSAVSVFCVRLKFVHLVGERRSGSDEDL